MRVTGLLDWTTGEAFFQIEKSTDGTAWTEVYKRNSNTFPEEDVWTHFSKTSTTYAPLNTGFALKLYLKDCDLTSLKLYKGVKNDTNYVEAGTMM